jgi:hypothetical protein
MKDTAHTNRRDATRQAGVTVIASVRDRMTQPAAASRATIDPVDTRDPAAVEHAVCAIHSAIFPGGDRAFVPQAFAWALQCFAGRTADYLPVDTRYHDLEHTMQGTLCLARLLQGRHAADATPSLPAKAFELTLLGILFHDSGYFKRRDDTEGTGAKYTVIHVNRSASFAAEFFGQQGFADADLIAMQNMIMCTGVDMNLKAIPFQSEMERMTGFALGTADLLGQMAARDYVEKLPLLYDEFAECARFAGPSLPPTFAFESAEELMRGTPAFWEHYVLPKIDVDFGGLYRFLSEPYPDGPNLYVQRIEENLTRLRQMARR